MSFSMCSINVQKLCLQVYISRPLWCWLHILLFFGWYPQTIRIRFLAQWLYFHEGPWFTSIQEGGCDKGAHQSYLGAVFLWIMDPHNRAPTKNTSHGNEVLPKDTTHLIQRSCYQRGSPCQDPAGSWTTRRPPDDRKRRKLQWYGHVSRSSGLAKTILLGTVKGGRRQGRQRKRREDNIREWTGPEFSKSQRAV